MGPFFPASNVLFYVGTFIGERLLYFPSGKPWCSGSRIAPISLRTPPLHLLPAAGD